ncbi:MAG: prephenate dehydrogenase [Candidatus Sericytochromatia bacterium]
MNKENIIGLKKGEIKLFPHNELWIKEFENEKNKILREIAPYIKTIDHVGSTSIKNISAKPIIDICIGITKFDDGFNCIEGLKKIGYEFMGEFGIEKRHYFRTIGEIVKFHIHMFELNSEDYNKTIFFRDYMNNNPNKAEEYEKLKLDLESKGLIREEYTNAKAPFINSILENMPRKEKLKTITVIGLGLIGGSIALDLKKVNYIDKIIGVDNNKENCKLALELNIVDEIKELDEAVKSSDLVLVSIPVNATEKVLQNVLDKINETTIVTDVGSTKENICLAVENHKNRKNFVAGHPIAGTEHSGPKAAFSGLFSKKTGIICDQEKSYDFAVKEVEKIYQVLGMKILYMDSKAHDLHIAYVSHLSHISSFALGATVLEKEKDETTIFNLAGSGFESTVRLAKSSPAMWTPIFEQNMENVSTALDEYIKNLLVFKQYLDNKEYNKIFDYMKDTNEIRRVLDGILKK